MKSFICIAILIVCVAVSGSNCGRRHHNKYYISTTKACVAAKGTCFSHLTPKLCSSKTSITFGHCDKKNSGCCLKRDDICARHNGTCGVPDEKCTKSEGLYQTRFKCSDKSRCCLPIRKHKKHHGKHHRVRNTKQCEAVNGTCSKRSDCAVKSNIFIGKCDKAHQRCCINKDEVCKSLKGQCLTVKECKDKKGYHYHRRFTCAGSEGVCCLPRRHNKSQ